MLTVILDTSEFLALVLTNFFSWAWQPRPKISFKIDMNTSSKNLEYNQGKPKKKSATIQLKQPRILKTSSADFHCHHGTKKQ